MSNVSLVDCHAHLADREFEQDLAQVLESKHHTSDVVRILASSHCGHCVRRDLLLYTGTRATGVGVVVAVPETLQECTELLAIRDEYGAFPSARSPGIAVCAGIHPEKVAAELSRDPDVLERWTEWVHDHSDALCGIGKL